ncbi:hypothetical protein AVEN_174264-1 [Araneus ventricosus]|uniref:Uncharacterized protein n=1 Tax=Araneus ventricosus TaxID=182803 RepID=A0A4Y2NXF1_ARAVE|nr:hypothetical protein AVEN_174264-1 [Araneus ventricosus]
MCSGRLDIRSPIWIVGHKRKPAGVGTTHVGSSVESGFEPVSLRLRGRHLTARPLPTGSGEALWFAEETGVIGSGWVCIERRANDLPKWNGRKMEWRSGHDH